jgi:hypothetical protein
MTAGDDEVWLDEKAGRLIRPYTMNGGRTRPVVDLDLLSLVITTDRTRCDLVEPEHLDVLDLCRTPLSVAEVAARLRLPVAVTKVLVADLVDRGAMATQAPYSWSGAGNRLLLEQLLDGLQRI